MGLDRDNWAAALGVSRAAIDLYLASEVIDLHTDSFIWKRVFGYRMERHHPLKPWGAPFWGQVDFPRLREAHMAGVVWDIPTNPLRLRSQKFGVLRHNISQILTALQAEPDQAFVRTFRDYQRVRAEGKMAGWISIQGGQALDNNLYDLERIPEVHRITLVHFSRSRIGASNFDGRNAHVGLSPFGRAFVARMTDLSILVDLSHINRKGFFDALDVMPAEIPPVVTHTGVQGVRPLWRNIDDQQIRAIAERNGTIGIICAAPFLAAEPGRRTYARIVDHMAHVIRVAGEDYVSLGSDFDGLITTPEGLPDITALPRLVQDMLERGWSDTRIQKILGGNFLRVVAQVQP